VTFGTSPLRDWLQTPLGVGLCAREEVIVAEALEQVFGRQLLQVGVWGGSDLFLEHARTARRTLVDTQSGPGVAMRCDPAQLGVAPGSVDVLLLPHTLELHSAPHEVLREAARVLAGEGRLIVLGFNPHGFWGVRRALTRGRFPQGVQRFISEGRLRDWLALLGFEMQSSRRYGHQLPFHRSAGPDGRFEGLGARFWPRLSAAYLIVARKRVYTFTPARPVWSRKRAVVGGLVEPMTRTAALSSSRRRSAR
jgi:SAM-dependent methyltransferase